MKHINTGIRQGFRSKGTFIQKVCTPGFTKYIAEAYYMIW